LCVDKPLEVGCRTISSVGREPFRFDAETCFGPLETDPKLTLSRMLPRPVGWA
jgi:hypothetical protein